jgi:3D (Asp-Asp-Asp) domain-containing protein
MPVLAVAALLTVAALALQGTRGGKSGPETVAATGPQLAAFSVTAKELAIDQAAAAEVPLSGGVDAGALVAGGSTTEVTEAPTTAATVAIQATAAPTTAKKAAATTAATTTAATTTAAAATTAASTTAAAITEAPTTAAPAPVADGAPPGAQPLGEFTVVCYVIVGTTYSGEPTGPNVVAVDKSVIPLHTNLWIEGVGPRTALDIGGGVRGKTLDLWMTWPDCKQFGKQHLNVYVVP